MYMLRSIIKGSLLAGAALLISVSAEAQCKAFAKNKCVPELAPYKFNENFNAAQLSPGDEAEVAKRCDAMADLGVALGSAAGANGVAELATDAGGDAQTAFSLGFAIAVASLPALPPAARSAAPDAAAITPMRPRDVARSSNRWKSPYVVAVVFSPSAAFAWTRNTAPAPRPTAPTPTSARPTG